MAKKVKEENLTPVEETTNEVVVEKHGKVEIKEEAMKMVNLVKAPEEIKKIIEFYGITSKDLFEWKFEWLKDDEVKALKEWYATLA